MTNGRNAAVGRRRRSVLEVLESRRPLAVTPILTELQASNNETLVDNNQESSDWIEIHNPDALPMNIGGWFLTDNEADLRKWRFPDGTTLAPGEYQIIFASGNDRTDAAEHLHTNFRLSRQGEFLALVNPDGVVVQSYDPFLPQQTDQSYGLAAGRVKTELIPDNTEMRAWIPTDDSLGLRWTAVDFEDHDWTPGMTPVGFEQLTDGIQLREEFNHPLGPEWKTDIPLEGTSTTELTDSGLRINVPTRQNSTFDERGLAPFVYREFPQTRSSNYEFTTFIRQGSSDRGYAGLGIVDGLTGKLAVQVEYQRRQFFRFSAGGNTQATQSESRQDSYFLKLARNEDALSWSAYFKLAEGDAWILLGTVEDGVNETPVVNDPKIALFARTPSSRMDATFEFLEIDIAPQRPVYHPEIQTNISATMYDQHHGLYTRIPFTIEGDPQRFHESFLDLRFDDAVRVYLNGTEITSQNMPDLLTWNSSAAGSHGAARGLIPERRIDVSGFINLLNSGQNVLAIHAANLATDDSDFFVDAVLQAVESLPNVPQTFLSPTPGQANLLPSLPRPLLTDADGVFFGSQTVEMKLPVAIPDVEIRYTLDGTEPTRESLLYNGVFAVRRSVMLEARAFDTRETPRFEPSNQLSATLVAVGEDLRDRDSNIPIIILDTLGQTLPNSNTTSLAPSNVVVFDVSQATGRATIGGNVEYLGRGGLRDRGSTTRNQPKPNMVFETWGPQGTTSDDDFSTSIAGLPPESDWVLYGPWRLDSALIRNPFYFEIGDIISNKWVPRTRFVEVYKDAQNGSGQLGGDSIITEIDYMGTYVLIEKIKLDQNRVDIAEITPADSDPNSDEITGGYIWKLDRPDPTEPPFQAGGRGINWVEPKSPEGRGRLDQKVTPAQQDWVIQFLDDFQASLAQPDLFAADGYANFIEIETWIAQHQINVLVHNVDAFHLSTYFYKDRNSGLQYGPGWDCDRCLDSDDGRDNDPRMWAYFFSAPWFNELFRDVNFWQRYVDRWQELRRRDLSNDAIDQLIDELASQARESTVRNFVRWTDHPPRAIGGFPSGKLDQTWEGEIEHLRAYVKERVGFMDSNFVQPPQLEIAGRLIGEAPGIVLEADGEIDLIPPYKQRFVDTTLISAVPGETTASYYVPGDDSLADDWTQLGFDDSAWPTGQSGLGNDVAGGDFEALIQTQVHPNDDQSSSTTLLTRYAFELDDARTAQSNLLELRMKYDDGFVAYLNGVEIARAAVANEPLRWDAGAKRRIFSDLRIAQSPQIFDISEFAHLLVDGTNVLAVRGVNQNSSSADILVLPELVSRAIEFYPDTAAQIYYTTDGTDPRGNDGRPNSSATRLPNGQSIQISTNTRIIARNFDDVTDRGKESNIVLTDWSSPIQYDFAIGDTPVVISEINYHPRGASPAEQDAGFSREDFEFVELHNPTSKTVNLIGTKLSGGVEFDFHNSVITSLNPGDYAVVVRNEPAFKMRYGFGLPIAGQYARNLDNRGEELRLLDSGGKAIVSVDYGNNRPWPVSAGGFGATLEWTGDEVGPLSGKWYHWRGSSQPGGSPGLAGADPVGIVVNEVLANPGVLELPDSIELLNTTAHSIDVGGWWLSDAAEDRQKFQIPENYVIPPGGYAVFDERNFNTDEQEMSFGLSANSGDEVWLTTSDGKFVDDVHFGPTPSGISIGRFPNGNGNLAPLKVPTIGTNNEAAAVGPVAISQVQYHPKISDAAVAAHVVGEVVESDLEFVQLKNHTRQLVDLSRWRIRGGIDYDFEADTQLAPHGTLMLVRFDPNDPENINELQAFRAHYDLPSNVTLVGGYAGRLNNNGDRITLQRPGEPPLNEPNRIPYLQEDEVLYDDQTPWLSATDGTGRALVRIALTQYGNDPTNWRAGDLPTSLVSLTSGDVNGDGQVDANDINRLFEEIRSPAPNLNLDLNADGQVNADDRDELVEVLLGTSFGDANLDGVFDSHDLVLVSQAGLYENSTPSMAEWQTGDWDGDGKFTSQDVVFAFQRGGFVITPANGEHRLNSNKRHPTNETNLAIAAYEPDPKSPRHHNHSPLQPQSAVTSLKFQRQGSGKFQAVDECLAAEMIWDCRDDRLWHR